MLKKIFIVLALIVIVFVVVVATRPANFRITRSITMDAPAGAAFSQVNDFHKWENWSPWAKLDPAMKQTYSGAPKDLGAVYAWEGNKDVGSGRMEVISLTQPTKVGIKLDFFVPIASTAMTDFVLEPRGDGTTVTWTMSGKTDFMAKMMSIFVSMDSMIGPAFESGLSQMKAVAEK